MMRMLLFIFSAAIIVLAAAAPFLIRFGDGSLGAGIDRRFEDKLLSTLVEKPEIVIQALQSYERKQAGLQQNALKSAVRANFDRLTKDPSDPVGGNRSGEITVVEFFDYNCPYCRQAKPIVRELLKADKRVRYVYKEFPILTESSDVAARAALAVWRKSSQKYEEFHLAMLDPKGGGSLTSDRIFAIASDLGIDINQLRDEMEKQAIYEKIESTKSLARSLSINATPTFVIGERVVPGLQSLEQFVEAVNQAAELPQVER